MDSGSKKPLFPSNLSQASLNYLSQFFIKKDDSGSASGLSKSSCFGSLRAALRVEYDGVNKIINEWSGKL
jgi:hypothetical protein